MRSNAEPRFWESLDLMEFGVTVCRSVEHRYGSRRTTTIALYSVRPAKVAVE